MLAQASAEETQMALQQATPAGDKTLVVRFAKKEHEDDAASREAGRPIFVMADYITIFVPGDKANSIDRPVRAEDKLRFPEQWMRFLASEEQVTGTPLSSWNQLTPAMCSELKYFNVLTIEQLASISDERAQKFLGINELRTKAQKYLKLMAEEAPLLKLQAELQSRDEQIATQAKQISDLQEAFEELKRLSNPQESEAPTPARRR